MTGQGGQIGAQVPDERRLLREAITWARANGWTPHLREPGGETAIVWRRGAFVEPGVPAEYVGVNPPVGADANRWMFTHAGDNLPIRSITDALDLLFHRYLLPEHFSTAYVAGVQAGRREVLDGAGCPPGSGLGRWVQSYTHYDVEFQTADGETRIECFGPGGDRTSPYHAARTFAQRLHSEWVRSELRRSRADTYHADETVLERFGAWEPVDGGDS